MISVRNSQLSVKIFFRNLQYLWPVGSSQLIVPPTFLINDAPAVLECFMCVYDKHAYEYTLLKILMKKKLLLYFSGFNNKPTDLF